VFSAAWVENIKYSRKNIVENIFLRNKNPNLHNLRKSQQTKKLLLGLLKSVDGTLNEEKQFLTFNMESELLVVISALLK